MRPRHNKWSIVILRFINKKKLPEQFPHHILNIKFQLVYFLLVKEENCWYNVLIAIKKQKNK